MTRPPEWKLPKPKGKYIRASVIELLPDPLSPLFATLGLPAWNRAMHRFALAEGMGNFVGDMLTTINGYAFYDLSYRTALMKPKVLTTVAPRLMYTAQQRWEQEARPAYKAVVERWEAVKLSKASTAELLVGTREILNAAASYYLTIQSGILPAAYLTETIFTIVYEKLLKRRADPSALTFLLGYDSAPIRAEKSLYDLAQWVRTQDELNTVLQNMSGARFASAYQTAHVDGIDETLWSAFCQCFTAHFAQFGHAIYDLDFSKPVPADDPEAVIALDRGQSPANYHTPVSERRTTWECERMLRPPIALPLKGGTRLLGINFSSMLPARIAQSAGDVLKGIAASPGHITGMARVIHGADEFAQMRQGEILVARITTPAWTPLFALAAGVVTDVGGPLSHSSIVAREYRIPAVLGTGVATERLHTGQNVTVDGDAGTVTLSR